MATASARLQAIIGLDTTEYKANMDGARALNKGFTSDIERSSRSIRNASQISNGFAQVLRGNVAGGLKQITAGLDDMSGSLGKVVGSIGAVGAAFGAGWQIGKKLDDWLGLSDRLGKSLANLRGGPQEGNLAQAQAAGARAANRERWAAEGDPAELAKRREEAKADVERLKLAAMTADEAIAAKQAELDAARVKRQEAAIKGYGDLSQTLLLEEQRMELELQALRRKGDAEHIKQLEAARDIVADSSRRAFEADIARENQRIDAQNEANERRIEALRNEFSATSGLMGGIRAPDSMATVGGSLGANPAAGERAAIVNKLEEIRLEIAGEGGTL